MAEPVSSEPVSSEPVTAEVVTIGDELVLGVTADTNARDLAVALRSIGVRVTRSTTIGDDVTAIAATVREAAARAPIVLTTGGLGPTFDDPTRDAVACAAGVATAFDGVLWDTIRAVFARRGKSPTDNNRAQAYLPVGATPIDNPVGTAPAFAVDIAGSIVISLPGVPREMRAIVAATVLPLLAVRFGLNERLWLRTLHCRGIGESALDAAIADVIAVVAADGPLAIGLAAHHGTVDVRLTARTADRTAADDLFAPVEAAIRDRLGTAVVGVEDAG